MNEGLSYRPISPEEASERLLSLPAGCDTVGRVFLEFTLPNERWIAERAKAKKLLMVGLMPPTEAVGLIGLKIERLPSAYDRRRIWGCTRAELDFHWFKNMDSPPDFFQPPTSVNLVALYEHVIHEGTVALLCFNSEALYIPKIPHISGHTYNKYVRRNRRWLMENVIPAFSRELDTTTSNFGIIPHP